VLRVGDGVADDVLEEDLEHAAGLLVDEPGDALHAAPPRQPPDRWLRDALDVVAEDLAVTLRAALAQPLAALAAPRHGRSLARTRRGWAIGGFWGGIWPGERDECGETKGNPILKGRAVGCGGRLRRSMGRRRTGGIGNWVDAADR
jgi:hypothetical protein